MRIDNYNLIKEKYLPIWEDFENIGWMDLSHNQRAEVTAIYRAEVDASWPDNPGCSRCIVELMKNLINCFKSQIV